MTTVTQLRDLKRTWDDTAGCLPEEVPAVGYRLWLTAHALVNRGIPIEQAAYLHAAANLQTEEITPRVAAEYDQTLSMLHDMRNAGARTLHAHWRALNGWGQYDPTPEARRENRRLKIDRYRESLLAHALRIVMTKGMTHA